MVKIYTKKGDFGETGVIAGKRILKSELVIEANGALDETSCFIGWAREMVEDEKIRSLLDDIQHDLYEIMGYLAGTKLPITALKRHIVVFEKYIDKTSKILPELHRFILPQGGEVATRLHIARTIVRSAERRVVRLTQERLHTKTKMPKGSDEFLIIQYLNRLSDLFFVLARKYAQIEKVT